MNTHSFIDKSQPLSYSWLQGDKWPNHEGEGGWIMSAFARVTPLQKCCVKHKTIGDILAYLLSVQSWVGKHRVVGGCQCTFKLPLGNSEVWDSIQAACVFSGQSHKLICPGCYLAITLSKLTGILSLLQWRYIESNKRSDIQEVSLCTPMTASKI